MAGNNPYAAPKANLAMPDSGGVDTSSPFSPRGRFARSTYMAYSFGSMFVVMLLVAAMTAAGLMQGGTEGMSAGTQGIVVVAYIAVLVVGTIFGIRRLHDLNWSGWWIPVMYIPLVGLVLAVPMMFFRGTAGANKYGPPRPPRTLHVVLTWVLGLVSIIGIVAAIAIPAYVEYTKRAKMGAMPQPPAVEQPQGGRP